MGIPARRDVVPGGLPLDPIWKSETTTTYIPSCGGDILYVEEMLSAGDKKDHTVDKIILFQKTYLPEDGDNVEAYKSVHVLNKHVRSKTEISHKVGTNRYGYLVDFPTTLQTNLDRFGYSLVEGSESSQKINEYYFTVTDGGSRFLNYKATSTNEQTGRLKQKKTVRCDSPSKIASREYPIRTVISNECFADLSRKEFFALRRHPRLKELQVQKYRQRFTISYQNDIMILVDFDSATTTKSPTELTQLEFEFYGEYLSATEKIEALYPFLDMMKTCYGITPNADNNLSKIDWLVRQE